MLPDIRAVIAAIVGATALMMIAFGVIAMFRVAQESRAGLLHADLAQRGRAAPPEHRPVAIIETPGPTVMAKAPEVETALQQPPAAESIAPFPTESERAPDPIATASLPESLPAESEPLSARDSQAAEAQPKAQEPALLEVPAPLVIVEAPPEHAAQSTVPPEQQASQPEPQASEPNAPSSPVASSAMGGPSPEEIAEANARHKAAQRARARKAAAEKRKAAAEKARKVLAARLARERKAAIRRTAATRAKQQAASSRPQNATQPSGFSFYPTGSFNSAPFGNTFNTGSTTTTGSATKPR